MTTRLITLPLAHARGVIKHGAQWTWLLVHLVSAMNNVLYTTKESAVVLYRCGTSYSSIPD